MTARRAEGDGMATTAYLDFGQQRAAAQSADGWLQGRYYSTDGLSVRKFLSFNAVFDICPFEVGAPRTAARRAYRARFAEVARLLELEDLLPRAFQTLSNGEMRRVLFARAVLKGPDVLVVDDPLAGLDPARRARFREIFAALARAGVTVKSRRAAGASDGPARPARAARPSRPAAPPPGLPPAFALRDVTVAFGRRRLFDGFSWTVRAGERWVLKGRNGSGKTTLFALITGDSPLGYANDVTVFGVRRGEGALADVRARIGVVSPEMQTYGGKGAAELLAEALAREPGLLLLDEPCMNLGAAAARRLLKKVAAWLAPRPHVAAVCVAHCAEHVPAGFDRVMDLDRLARRP